MLVYPKVKPSRFFSHVVTSTVTTKMLQNNFLALGYPGGLISKVITRAKSSSALKMIGPQKCPVYLKLPFFGKVSENFTKRISEEVGQVFGSDRLRTVLYTYRQLSEIYKDVSPIQKKSNIIYSFSCNCGSDCVGKTSQRFHFRKTTKCTMGKKIAS